MNKQPLRILLVDDDEDDYIITRDLLAEIEGQSYNLEWVATYKAALERISHQKHDLYLIDYRLGQHTGLELLNEVMTQGCKAPLILLTGQGGREIDLQAMQAGAADYLVKGQMDALLLERSIRYALEHTRAQAEIQQRTVEIQHRNRELVLLNRVIAASTAELNPEAILKIACRELALTFDLPQSAAALLNEDNTEAVIVAEYLGKSRPSAMGRTLPIADNPSFQHLITHKSPLVIANAQKDPRLNSIQSLMQQRETVTLLLLPIIIENEVVGSLGLDAIESRQFSPEEINLAWSVAGQVAGALARARMAQTHQRLNTAIEQSAESVIMTDVEGIILYVNPSFERITGYTSAEVLGQTMRLLKSGRHGYTFYRDLWKTISNGQIWHGQFTNKKKDGTLYTAESTITPIRGEGGDIVNYVGVARDVTRELQLELQLHHSQKMDAIGKLAGGVAHDFNNLLTAIMSYAGFALDALPNDSLVCDDIKGIQKSTQRAAGLTRQLLAFARKQIIEPKIININNLVLDMDKMLRRLISENIELVTLPSSDLDVIKADLGQLEQVLVNLVLNARDAMPDGGKLIIETANVTLDRRYTQQHFDVTAGNYVMLAVSDTGIGMTEETKQHIFEPFFTTKDVGKGTGLGLATVFGIVKQNRGHIWVYSEPGQGATFKIYLPYVEGLVSKNRLNRQAHQIPFGTERLLLVEDEPTVLELTTRLLRRQGYTLLTASNGEEALRLVEEQTTIKKIDLLVTDVVMPHMGGKLLADHLKTIYPGLKVLFMSGYTDNAIVHQGILAAETDFLQKPFTPDVLARKVRQVLDKG